MSKSGQGSKMMGNNIRRIIILTNTLKNGGSEKQSILLAGALREKYKTTLIVYYGKEYDEKLKTLSSENNVYPIFLEGSHLGKILFLYRLFKGNNNTVIFSYLATTNFLNAIIGSFAGIKFRIGGIRSTKLSYPKFFLQRILHNRLLTLSVFNNYAGQKSLCEKGFAVEKSIVIHNAIDIKLPAHNKKKDSRVFNILSIGRFIDQKDYFTSIDAVTLLANSISGIKPDAEIKYTIVGYGDLEGKIRSYILSKNLEKIIQIIINPPEISEYLAMADIYLSTSLNEGLSNSIMEAMEYSLPIVATNAGDNNYLVKDGYNGFLTPVKEAGVISARLLRLIKNDTERAEMGVNSYNLLRDSFSCLTFKQNYIELISGLGNEVKA
jgi:glycosyltransferase involved in cell wall biosynthesis